MRSVRDIKGRERMKIIRSYINFWWFIGKEENGWDWQLATPHIDIQRIPLDKSIDWHITINLIFFGCVIGWETNQGRSMEKKHKEIE